MIVSPSPEQHPPIHAGLADDSSLSALLERGMAYIRQRCYAEGVALLSLAREQVSPLQADLIDALDAFLHRYTVYGRVHTQLQEASKQYAEAYEELQAHAVILKIELSPLIQHLDSTSSIPLLPPFLMTNGTSHDTPSSPEAVPQKLIHAPSQSHSSSVLQPLARIHTPVPAPELAVTCFSRFEVRRFGEIITLCPNRSGQTILRYLIAQTDHRASSDALMGVLWPDDEPEVARHKLQVAVSALRRSLINGSPREPGSYIQCKDRVYQLNPEISLSSDVDEFLLLYHAGRQAGGNEAITQYEKACRLYTGPFLVEDMYADWASRPRNYLCRVYLVMCSALAEHYLAAGHYERAEKWANAILEENRCEEAAHRQLMRAYTDEGRRSEAVRQYQRCERTLREELGVAPTSETTHLLQTILGQNQTEQP